MDANNNTKPLPASLQTTYFHSSIDGRVSPLDASHSESNGMTANCIAYDEDGSSARKFYLKFGLMKQKDERIKEIVNDKNWMEAYFVEILISRTD